MIYNPALMNLDRARLFDKRVVQRNIRAGRVTKDEYRSWLGELSDTSEKIRPRDEGGDDDGYERPEPGSIAASAPAAAPVVAAPVTAPVVAAPVTAPINAPAPAVDVADPVDPVDQEPPHGEAG